MRIQPDVIADRQHFAAHGGDGSLTPMIRTIRCDSGSLLDRSPIARKAISFEERLRRRLRADFFDADDVRERQATPEREARRTAYLAAETTRKASETAAKAVAKYSKSLATRLTRQWIDGSDVRRGRSKPSREPKPQSVVFIGPIA